MLKHVLHIVLSDIIYKDWVQFSSLTQYVVTQKMKLSITVFGLKVKPAPPE